VTLAFFCFYYFYVITSLCNCFAHILDVVGVKKELQKMQNLRGATTLECCFLKKNNNKLKKEDSQENLMIHKLPLGTRQ